MECVWGLIYNDHCLIYDCPVFNMCCCHGLLYGVSCLKYMDVMVYYMLHV